MLSRIDFAANAMPRFDPRVLTCARFANEKSGARVRQMLGCNGVARGAESDDDRRVVNRY